jgi:hypothetical protein
MIDSLNNGSYTIIDSLNITAGTSKHIDAADIVTGATYAMGVLLPGGCTTTKVAHSNAKGSKAAVLTMSISNKSSIMVGFKSIYRQNINLSIYPNPSTGIFQIKSDLYINRIEIRNTIGQIILSIENENKVDLSGYTSGIYYATIYTSYGPSTKKIILR